MSEAQAEMNPTHPGPLEDLAQLLKDLGRMTESKQVLTQVRTGCGCDSPCI